MDTSTNLSLYSSPLGPQLCMYTMSPLGIYLFIYQHSLVLSRHCAFLGENIYFSMVLGVEIGFHTYSAPPWYSPA